MANLLDNYFEILDEENSKKETNSQEENQKKATSAFKDKSVNDTFEQLIETGVKKDTAKDNDSDSEVVYDEEIEPYEEGSEFLESFDFKDNDEVDDDGFVATKAKVSDELVKTSDDTKTSRSVNEIALSQSRIEREVEIANEQNTKLIGVLGNMADAMKANANALNAIETRLDTLENKGTQKVVSAELIETGSTDESSENKVIVCKAKDNKKDEQKKETAVTKDSDDDEIVKKNSKSGSGSSFIIVGAIFLILAVAIAIFMLNKVTGTVSL